MRYPFCYALLLVALFTCTADAAPVNLLPNGGFESGIDTSWRKYTPRLGPAIATTETLPLEGARCAAIETTTDLIGILACDPVVEVAAGEKLTMRISCRAENVASDTGGGLTFTAAFVNSAGRIIVWDRANVLAAKAGEWQRLEHETTVPDGAAGLMFQFGLRRAHGRTWWDAASVESSSPVALRIDVPRDGAAFGHTTLSAVLLNRHLMPEASSLCILTRPGEHHTHVTLDKGTSNALALPFTFMHRGKVQISAEVIDDSDQAHSHATQTGKQGRSQLFVTSDTVTISDALVAEPLIPTHWVVEDSDQPGFEAQLQVNVEPSLRSKVKLLCIVRNSTENIVTQPLPSPLPPCNPVPVSVELPPGSSPGDYRVTFQLLENGHPIASAEEDWHVIHRSEALTSVSPDGYPVVAGKKTFPIAMYMADDNWFRELKSAGFNVTQSYPAFAGPGSSNRTAKQFLDDAHKAGLKTLTFITHGPDRLPDDEALKRIRMFRNHPATLVWYQEEVLARGYKPMSYVENLVGMLRREAPEHPILQGDQRDESSLMIGNTRWFPDEYMDFGTWWWYPTPLRETASMENYEGDPSGPEKEYKPPKFLTDNGTSKPIWMAIQCYAKPGQSDARFPTPAEYRCHAYLSICHGAKGLLYYTGLGENGTGVLSRPKEGHWDYLKKLVGELRDMSPVFMSADAAKQPDLLTTGALVSARLKQTDNGMVLLTVNRSIVPTRGEFRVSGLSPAASVRVKYEDRTVKPTAGVLSDDFEPYAVHIYEMPLP
ncbi:MAG: hypothetical protein ACR2IE_12090 [Candidatus Sumerlaeaceae bacterium]